MRVEGKTKTSSSEEVASPVAGASESVFSVSISEEAVPASYFLTAETVSSPLIRA